MNDLAITRLLATDAPSLSQLLNGDDKEYQQYFIPFAADPESLAQRLATAGEDRYWGVWNGPALAGFFMMRGFDEGYSRPSFGVYIGSAHAGQGLSRLALEYCMSWCRFNNINAMMLKVHPENRYARHSYEKAGFTAIDTCPRTGHTVMEKRWGNGV